MQQELGEECVAATMIWFVELEDVPVGEAAEMMSNGGKFSGPESDLGASSDHDKGWCICCCTC
jgi:hypothetical protein